MMQTPGCDGSALDLKVRVKDVGPSTPPTGLILSPYANTQDKFSIYWDTPHADQFIENGIRTDFPDPSFNVTSLVIRHEPNGLWFRESLIDGPIYFQTRTTGIQGIQGTPGVTYTITARLSNSEGLSTRVSAQIRLPGPPAAPEAPTVRPESETSISVVWEEPDDGGRPITGYEVQYQKNNTNTWEEWPHTGTGTSTIIKSLVEMSEYDIQIKAKNEMGSSDWSPTGTGRTVGLVVQITSAGNITSGNDAVFTLTLSKTATVTVNLTHAWTGEYGESNSDTLPFDSEISKNYPLPTARGNPGADGGSVTVTIDTDAAYEIGTGGSATVDIEQDPSSQPTLAPPSNQGSGAVYKFPAGKTDGIKYDFEPGTDQDGDTLAYLITFTNPETDTKEEVTIPADGTAADLPGTLLTIKRSEYNFIFEPDGNVTPDQFEATYGNVESHHEEKTLDVQLRASDGTELSPPVDFTLKLHYDPSGYFPEPSVNRSISRWELPDTIETYEGTAALSGATVEWTSPLSGTRNWATGNPTIPVSCRHGPANQANQEWPDAGNEDSDLFTLDTSTTTGDRGSITFSFKDPPDFESPSDSDKDNTYKLRLHNIHSLHQVTGDQIEFPACSGSAIDVTVIVINVNEPPMFPSETDDRSVTENTEEGQPIGDPVEAEDLDPDETLTYTLGGDDATSFDIIESTGQLQTKANLDYETKDSYTVTVTATDKEDLSDSIEVTITVTDLDEGPEVSGAPTRDYAENGTDPVATYTATNPENGQIAWSLLGDDSENFSINSGVLAFNAPPDYEAPADADTNNVYLVTVRASDGNNADTLAVTVTITDKNEPPAFTEEIATRTIAENTAAGQNIGPPFLATDPDAGDTPAYTLGGTNAASFGIVATSGQLQTKATLDHETKDSYTVTITATDSSDASDTITVTITVTNVNETPEFPSTETGDRQVAENTVAGEDIGATVAAIDPDAGDTLTYTLEGTDLDSFNIDSASGQIQTKSGVTYDHEVNPATL